MDGIYVDREVTVAHLKGTLEALFKKLYGEEAKVMLRPSFFGFVEPGFEVFVSCFKCGGMGTDCSLCKRTGWIEVLGAGLIHPNVFRAVGIDPLEWKGFAFGMGVDRVTMLKFGIDDARLSYSGDLRFIKQF
jgi:phenylalanyl-tRNA synthetase alpha chain